MSKLDELIRELCPDGAEYVKLNSVCDIYDGTHSTPNYTESGVKFASVENIGDLYATQKYISEKDFEKYKIKPRIGDVMMTRIGSVGVCTVVDRNEALAFYVSLALLRPQLDKVQSRFLKYAIESIHGRKELRKRTLINAVPIKINKDDIGKVTIPLPPIEIQSEIVRVLDNFTNLTAELTAELTARKMQYSYYRDNLLSFNMSVSKKKIGEITRVFSAARVHKNEWTQEGVPFYRSSDVISKFNGVENSRGKAYISFDLYKRLSAKSGKIMKDDILITGGGTIGIPYVVPSDEPIYVKDADLLCIQKSKEFNSRFLFHYFLSTEFRKYLENITHNATIAHYTISQIENTPVPLPPLDVQNRIVNVLDNFEKICSDLNIGLPAEIEARQKQHEYYRDKLLTFAETGNTILNGTERNGTERNGTERNGTLIKLLQYVFGYVRISLGDIGSICMCKRILKSQTNTVSGVPFYKIGTFGKEADAYISQETFNEYRSRYNFPKKGDVLISAAGTIGRTVVYDGKPAYFQDSNIVWIDNDESIVLNSYLRYCYELKPWKASEGGTIPRLYNDNIAKAVIAVPSIEEQKRVVSILDRFDAICNDLTGGLPAEIEARRKQYEYYRDKLLNFGK